MELDDRLRVTIRNLKKALSDLERKRAMFVGDGTKGSKWGYDDQIAYLSGAIDTLKLTLPALDKTLKDKGVLSNAVEYLQNSLKAFAKG